MTLQTYLVSVSLKAGLTLLCALPFILYIRAYIIRHNGQTNGRIKLAMSSVWRWTWRKVRKSA